MCNLEVDERQEKNTRREHQPPKERTLTHFNTCKRSIAQNEPPKWAAIFDEGVHGIWGYPCFLTKPN